LSRRPRRPSLPGEVLLLSVDEPLVLLGRDDPHLQQHLADRLVRLPLRLPLEGRVQRVLGNQLVVQRNAAKECIFLRRHRAANAIRGVLTARQKFQER
jgi:hypothetical protein